MNAPAFDELSYGDTTVRAAFELSYQRLHPDLRRLFRLFTINPGPRSPLCYRRR